MSEGADVRSDASNDAMFRALVEAAPDAMLVVDHNGVVRFANQQAEALFGYRRDEIIGNHLEIFIPERSRAVHPAHRNAYFRSPRTRPMGAGLQLAARRKDGTEFPVDIALSYLETEEGPLATAAVRDVSEQWAWAERERLLAQLNQSQRLESLGRLAGGIAHDFNNLLVVILNYARFVRDELAANPSAAQALDDVEQIHRAAERAATLTHQLLMFSRREVVKPVVLDLNGVVEELEKLLRRTIGEDIVLSTSLAPTLWRVLADASQMEQVLVNLTVNARDAMPDGGELVVETANVAVEDEPLYVHGSVPLEPGKYVRLSVSDSGSGMTPDVVDRAFEPFFTTKPRGSGSGLGLATVWGVVADSGGRIGVYSEPGDGTTFRIYLPAADEVERAAELAPHGEGARGDGLTILVVEDEDAVRDMTTRILRGHGYEAVAVASGDEALTVVADNARHIDLLLTDVVMPGLSGKELSERATALRPELRVVFMSGYSEEFVSRRLLDPGLWLVEKPFTAAALLARIGEAIADGA